MECVAQVVRGNDLNTIGECAFCGKESVAVFCVTKGKKYDGTLLTGFHICKDHHDRLNSLISGEFDIDQIYLESQKHIHTNKFNVRRK